MQVKQKRKRSLKLGEIVKGFMGVAGSPWPYWNVGGMFQKWKQAQLGQEWGRCPEGHKSLLWRQRFGAAMFDGHQALKMVLG